MARVRTLVAVLAVVALVGVLAVGGAGASGAGEASGNATVSGTLTSAAADGSLSGDNPRAILKQSGTVVDSTYADSNGNYAFHNISDGTYTVVAKADSHREASSGSFSLAGSDATGQDLTLDGGVVNENSGNSYLSIQNAVDNASSGDRITVAPGTYQENLDIGTGDLTLESTGNATETVVEATTSGDDGVFVDAQNVVLDGFKFTGASGSGKSAVSFISAGGSTITNGIVSADYAVKNGIYTDSTIDIVNVNVTQAKEFGIWTDFGSSGTVINRSEIRGSSEGIRTNHDVSIRNNTIAAQTSNAARGTGYGIRLGGASDGTTIVDNEILNNDGTAIQGQTTGGSSISVGSSFATRNNIEGNGFGSFINSKGNQLDATGNWWNDPSGTDSGGNNGVSGDIDTGSPLSSANSGGPTVSGTITSGASDFSISSRGQAWVYLFQNGDVVDSEAVASDGSYGFRNVTDGSYMLVAKADGHLDQNAPVSVSGSDKAVDLTLQGAVENQRSGETFTSVQSAFDDGTYDVQSGDTITVHPGTYAESVDISSVTSASDLTLQSAGAATETVINGQGLTPTINAGSDADGLTLDGLTLETSGAPAALVNTFSMNTVTVRNSIVRASAAQQGISVNESATVVDNDISNTVTDGAGIELRSSGGTGSTIRRNEITGFGKGLNATDATDLTIENNQIQNNGDAIGEDAVVINADGTIDASTITLAQNNIVGNQFGFSTGGSGTINNEVDAENNWWGASDGPAGDGSGSGQGVVGPIDFDPWLDAAVPAGSSASEPPSINSFGASNPESQNVSVSIDSDEQLAEIEVSISGAESATLTATDFTESGSGPYTYSAVYEGSTDGDYTATLLHANDSVGNDGASGKSETVSVLGANGEVTFDGSPETVTVEGGQTTTVDVVIGDAASGVGSYDFTTAVTDDRIAEITNVDLATGGTGSQPDSQSISISGDGSSADIAATYLNDPIASGSPTVVTLTLEGSTVGSTTVTFTVDSVSDDSGSGYTVTAVNDSSVTVEDTTAPTVVAGSDRTVEAGIPVSFDASGSSDNVGIASYDWQFGDRTTGSGPTPSHTYDSPGQYTVSVTGTDPGGNADTDTLTIIAEDTTAPTADAGPDRTVTVGSSVSFDASGSSDNVGITSYEWEFGDGTTASGQTVSRTYSSTGSDTVTLTVTDDAGNSATDTVTIDVTEAPDTTPPTADAGPDRTVSVGSSVSFDASGSSDNDGIASYRWEFGDGTIAFGPALSHTYNSPGQYTVTLIVTDDAGNSDTDTLQVSVESVPTVEMAVRPPQVTTTNGSTVAVDVVARDASEGLGAYDLTLSVRNATTTTITNVSADSTTDLAPDGTSVTLTGDADTESRTATLGTVRLEGTTAGESALTLTVDSAESNAGEAIESLTTSDGSIRVVATPDPLPSSSGPPQSLDDDGRLEDVDGDGDASVEDAMTYYVNRNSETIRNNPELFDFDGDGVSGTVFDVVKLFREVS